MSSGESERTDRPLVIDGIDGLRERAGTDLGVSDWLTVDQETVSAFGALTGDEQWIHVDPERAAQGPFGRTVAHGFFTLAASTGLLWQVCTVDGAAVVVNYGLDRVRFPAPVPVGSRIRLHVRLDEVTDIQGGAQALYHLEYEAEGQPKPPCVAQLLFRYYT